MKINKKGRKTTIVSIITGVLGMSVFAMWYLDKIETSELMVALVAVTYLTNMVIGYLAKDKDQSHSVNLTVDPNRDYPDERG